MLTIVELLRQAISEGEIIAVVYNGGSHPGQLRPLIPLSLTDEDLSARDPSAHITKTFKLHKISSVRLSSGEILRNENATPIEPLQIQQAPSFATLAEYAEYLSPEFRAAGWNVIESENYLGVGTFLKNGKPRKSASISIQFYDRSIEPVFDWESGEVSMQPHELTGRERPWRVDPPGKTFTQLQKAAEVFIKEVRKNSPTAAQ